MKTAFLFLTRDDFNQPIVWDRFFSRACSRDCSIYSHAKSEEGIASPLLRDHAIARHTDTELGAISLVRATLFLLEEAFRDADNQFFVLCSESCVPIWSFDRVQEILSQSDRSRIHTFDNFEPKRYGALASPEFLPKEKFLKQHQWMILNREASDLILNNDFTEIFAGMYAPDEHYFICTLNKLGYRLHEKCLNQMTTWVNWDEPEACYTYEPDCDGGVRQRKWLHPKTYCNIEAKDINVARARGCLFFRKVSTLCPSDLFLEALKVS